MRPGDMIFPQAKRAESIAADLCVAKPFGCGEPIKGFRDELSRREYAISGLCQRCQDSVFDPDKLLECDACDWSTEDGHADDCETRTQDQDRTT